MEWIDKSYNWAKENTFSSTAMGWFPEIARKDREWSEPCCPADMVALAIKLSRAGAGDYWDDADRWTRNHLIETQTTDGGYGPGCCTGNAARALYYAWKNILEYEEGELRVNLLLNRASKWADVDSHVPYQGRVDIKPKQKLPSLAVRMPEWVESESKQVTCAVNNQPREFTWQGRYIHLGPVNKGAIVTVQFPIGVRSVNQHIVEVDRKLTIKGNEVISIEPREGLLHFTGYDRDHYLEDATRWVEIERFAPDHEIDW